MKKKLAFILVCLLMVMAPAVSFATVKNFANLSIDVPEGWQPTENGSVVALIAPDRSASMSIVVDSAQGLSVKELTDIFVAQMKGSTPESTGDGGFAFTFTPPNGVESHSVVYVEDNQYVMITMTGYHPDMDKILDSLQ